MAKGYIRPITRRQALSYERTVPNPIGVTTIASINGRGSYAKRNGVSQRIVRASLRGPTARSSRGSYEERYASARRILGRDVPRYEQNFSEGRGSRAVPNPRKKKEKRPMAGKRKKAKRKLTKAERAAISRRNLKKARAARKTGGGARKSTKTTRRASARRTTTGKRRTARRAAPRLLTARIGKTTRKTYMSATRGGKARKVPAYELLGFKSQKAMGDYLNSDKTPPKQVERLRKRLGSIFSRRKRASEHVLKHGDAFTPNKRVIPYSEWSASMTPNGKRKSKSRSAAAKKAARTRRRNAAAGVHPKRRKAAAKRRGKMTRAARRAAGLKAARTRKRNAAARKRPGKATKRRAAKRGGTRTRASYAKAARKAARTRKRNAAAGKRTRKAGKRKYRKNAHHSYRRHHRGHRFHKNAWLAYLKDGLMTGLAVVGGFLGHKVLTKALDDYGLAKVAFLNGPSVAPWRKTIGGLLVSAVAIPLAYKAAPSTATAQKIAGGMAASLLQQVIVTAMTQLNQPTVAGYLSGYPDQNDRRYGMGEYFTGMGEYVLPYAGLGDDGYMQAAAGFGGPMQAAAGYTQAAAGMGEVMQAAAGMGEYFASGAQGVGEYFETPGGASGFGYTDEGIAPNTGAAEYALNVSEAAAGVGGLGDIPFQSIWNPIGVAQAVNDAPTGSRAGIMYGQDGIFGN